MWENHTGEPHGLILLRAPASPVLFIERGDRQLLETRKVNTSVMDEEERRTGRRREEERGRRGEGRGGADEELRLDTSRVETGKARPGKGDSGKKQLERV